MSWLLEIVIESLDSKGLGKLFCILPYHCRKKAQSYLET